MNCLEMAEHIKLLQLMERVARESKTKNGGDSKVSSSELPEEPVKAASESYV